MNIKGECPMGCGETLFVTNNSLGYVTCSYIGCPDPARASDLLRSAVLVNKLVSAAHEAVESIGRGVPV